MKTAPLWIPKYRGQGLDPPQDPLVALGLLGVAGLLARAGLLAADLAGVLPREGVLERAGLFLAAAGLLAAAAGLRPRETLRPLRGEAGILKRERDELDIVKVSALCQG